MTTWYREIAVLQEPFDMGVDTNKFARVGFNIMGIKAASTTWLEDLKTLLEAGGVGIFGTNLFIGTVAQFPDSNGPFLNIRSTGGTSPERTQNTVTVPAYQRPGAQLVARAKNYEDAEAMAFAAYNVLVGVRNTNI
jgi:hypothetical protein